MSVLRSCSQYWRLVPHLVGTKAHCLPRDSQQSSRTDYRKLYNYRKFISCQHLSMFLTVNVCIFSRSSIILIFVYCRYGAIHLSTGSYWVQSGTWASNCNHSSVCVITHFVYLKTIHIALSAWPLQADSKVWIYPVRSLVDKDRTKKVRTPF